MHRCGEFVEAVKEVLQRKPRVAEVRKKSTKCISHWKPQAAAILCAVLRVLLSTVRPRFCGWWRCCCWRLPIAYKPHDVVGAIEHGRRHREQETPVTIHEEKPAITRKHQAVFKENPFAQRETNKKNRHKILSLRGYMI